MPKYSYFSSYKFALGFCFQSSQQQEQDETNLYFANLDPSMTEQDVRQALGQYGTVISVRILRDQEKRSRGVGFARMNEKNQCQTVIDEFHNKTFPSLFFRLAYRIVFTRRLMFVFRFR